MTEQSALLRMAYLRWKRNLRQRCKSLLSGFSGVPSFLFFGLLSVLIFPWMLLIGGAARGYKQIFRRVPPSDSMTEQQQEQIARDPETSPDQLQQLIATLRHSQLGLIRGRPALLESLAAHPNLSPDQMAELLNSSCASTAVVKGISRNPILPLLPLECPDFVTALAEPTVSLLLMQPQLPRPLALLLTMSTVPLMASTARSHIAFAGDVADGEDWRIGFEEELKSLITPPSDIARRCLYYELFCHDVVPEWVVNGGDPLADPVLCAEMDEDVPPEIVREALAQPCQVAIAIIEDNPTQLSNVLRQYMALPPQEVREREFSRAIRSKQAFYRALARHPDTPPLLLSALVNTVVGRLLVLRHPNCTPDIRQVCRQRCLEDTRTWAVLNLPAEFYVRCYCRNWRRSAISNRLPPNSFPFLIMQVRHLRPWLPWERRQLRRLAKGPNRYVRAAARERLSASSLRLAARTVKSATQEASHSSKK